MTPKISFRSTPLRRNFAQLIIQPVPPAPLFWPFFHGTTGRKTRSAWRFLCGIRAKQQWRWVPFAHETFSSNFCSLRSILDTDTYRSGPGKPT
jgi:hypothetical protein